MPKREDGSADQHDGERVPDAPQRADQACGADRLSRLTIAVTATTWSESVA